MLIISAVMQGGGGQSIVTTMFVCLSASLSARIFRKLHDQTSPNFLSVLTIATVRSSFGGIATSYVLPVCGWRHVFTRWRVMCISKRPERNDRNCCVASTRIFSVIEINNSTHRELRIEGEICYQRMPRFSIFHCHQCKSALRSSLSPSVIVTFVVCWWMSHQRSESDVYWQRALRTRVRFTSTLIYALQYIPRFWL